MVNCLIDLQVNRLLGNLKFGQLIFGQLWFCSVILFSCSISIKSCSADRPPMCHLIWMLDYNHSAKANLPITRLPKKNRAVYWTAIIQVFPARHCICSIVTFVFLQNPEVLMREFTRDEQSTTISPSSMFKSSFAREVVQNVRRSMSSVNQEWIHKSCLSDLNSDWARFHLIWPDLQLFCGQICQELNPNPPNLTNEWTLNRTPWAAESASTIGSKVSPPSPLTAKRGTTTRHH